MITNKGNQIVTKFMLGQVPEYAAYLSIGVGAEPLAIAENDATSPAKKSMDFEAFRVPVTSRGLVNDNVTIPLSNWSVNANLVTVVTSTAHGARIGDEIDVAFSASANYSKDGAFVVAAVSSTTITYAQAISASAWTTSASSTATLSYGRERIVFKAQLPSDQRYQMTEVGIWPAPSNGLALNYDSRAVAGFLTTEGWTYHDVSPGLIHSDNTIPLVTSSIADQFGNIGSATFVYSGSATTTMFLNSDNDVFDFADRKSRYETPRFLNRCLAVKGNLTSFTDDTMAQPTNAEYISTSGIKLDLSKNSPSDYIKLALAVLSSDNEITADPYKVRIRFELIDSNAKKAAATQLMMSASASFANGRYLVVPKQLRDFNTDADFNWSKITGIKLYAQSLSASATYDNSIIVFDGIRVENENTENPLYGMVAYSRLKNGYEDSQPVLKAENTQGYIEYRLGVNVV